MAEKILKSVPFLRGPNSKYGRTRFVFLIGETSLPTFLVTAGSTVSGGLDAREAVSMLFLSIWLIADESLPLRRLPSLPLPYLERGFIYYSVKKVKYYEANFCQNTGFAINILSLN